jgi:hypothetical protein
MRFLKKGILLDTLVNLSSYPKKGFAVDEPGEEIMSLGWFS